MSPPVPLLHIHAETSLGLIAMSSVQTSSNSKCAHILDVTVSKLEQKLLVKLTS